MVSFSRSIFVPVAAIALGTVPAPSRATAVDVSAAARHSTIACETLDDTASFGLLPVCIAGARFDRDLCRAIEDLADRQNLPPGFLARLIWQESRFDPNAVSPKGAQGIAQFIPSTARLRGLSDAFNPAEALAKSAAYLHQMQIEFGNLGLAAVGYNAGENRARALIATGQSVPAETARYVFDITGLPIGAWTGEKPKKVDFRLDDSKPFFDACIQLAKSRNISALAQRAAPFKPWGAEIGASFSPAAAHRIFDSVKAAHPGLIDAAAPMLVRARNLSFGTRSRYTVRIGRDSRAAAQKLCAGLVAAGGYCVVRKN